MNISYGYFKLYTISLFNFLNGKINKKIMANSIEFDIPSSPTEFGRTISSNIVVINLYNIIRFSYNKGYTSDEIIRGVILNSVCHELSHLDQDINFSRVRQDNDYMTLIEKSNDANALLFISNNYDVLQTRFGIFDMELIYKIQYTTDIARYSTLYTPIQSKEQKILSVLENLTESDICFIINNMNCEYIVLWYIDINNVKFKHTTMVNKEWLHIDDTLNFLGKVLSKHDVLSINIKASISEKSCNITIIQKEMNKLEPIKMINQEAAYKYRDGC